ALESPRRGVPAAALRRVSALQPGLNMDGRRVLLVVLIVVATLILTGCAASQLTMSAPTAPGFWLGLWHGLIAPVAFLIGLFNQHVRLYAFPNAGRWYD